jgi:RNA polymerase sigma-70 factor (ECF subfamily)
VREQETFFLELLREYDARLRRIARLYSADDDAARDLYQDIVVQVWRALPTFGGQSSAGTWMYRVALNTALDAVRRRDVRRRTLPHAAEAVHAPPAPPPDVHLERAESVRRLYAAIARLDEIDRALMAMYLDDRSYRDMAEVLGMSESNVGVRLHRAKQKLSRWLEEAA